MSDTPPVAVITGATDGIGQATARALTGQGWRVGVLGRNQERTETTVASINAARPQAAFPVVADLSSLAATCDAVAAIRAATDRLDVLALNANHITQEHQVTAEGFEANLAIGWLSRVVMMRGLESLIVATGGQILSVVGMNLGRIDSDDLSLPGSSGGMATLGQWQWAIQAYLRAWNTRSAVPANTYMPGLVKTKILDDEPGRMTRLAIKVGTLVMASSPEESAAKLVATIERASSGDIRDHYYSGAKDKGIRNLKASTQDILRIWDLSTTTTDPWLA
ncbi:MAG: SDR family NAD(P)-dependent oxidoreductase [Actinomycetes bacterium]